MNILIVDDEASLRRTLRIALESMSHHVVEARDGRNALDALGREPLDLAFVDLRLGQEQGLDLIPELLRLAPSLSIVVITAYATIATAVEAMRRGAFDYLPKPYTPDQLRSVLERSARLRRLQSDVADLEEQVRSAVPEADLRTEEPLMEQTLSVAYKAAPTDATMLLRGESGTGKGVLARAIHAHSPRAGGRFLESELFGHVRGAFTGAIRDTLGKVAAAEGGTLFLDEVGELPPNLQGKLLRLLQEKRYERVGDTQTRTADVRILAASNRDLEAETAAGKFREDLLYRLNVIEVTMPPLRQRRRDILPLAEHLLRFFAKQSGKTFKRFSEEARAAFLRYPWPGNVRELRNAVERAVILASGELVGLADLPAQISSPPPAGIQVGAAITLDQLEAEHIRRILTTTATMDEAAGVLGIDASTLYRKRKRYGL
ncbi:MAG: sigma-54-dependent Fis family transcriptional regulator [Planctomycetota bacterium]|nr:MAG: sigma-54-dependent Fis family transcriptional regulator [Planctomycetota bacterium]